MFQLFKPEHQKQSIFAMSCHFTIHKNAMATIDSRKETGSMRWDRHGKLSSCTRFVACLWFNFRIFWEKGFHLWPTDGRMFFRTVGLIL